MSDSKIHALVHYAFTGQQYEHLNLDIPGSCPHCNENCNPIYLTGRLQQEPKRLICATFECTNKKCKKTFLVDYNMGTGTPELIKIYPKTYLKRQFSEAIRNISPQFCEIFNQSSQAEVHALDQIAGVGYRKALEFLIKDYVISNKPELKDTVEKSMLSACIQQYIDNEKIKLVSKRAVWIGNDETHYVRKWIEKDIEDLKRLIDGTVNWIEMEIQTNELLVDMPE